MDCEKFDDALMDELYGELDEVTSAALRRHASTCARCADRLSSFRATRKVLATAFTPVETPDGLEERIFAAAAEARKVVPIRSRLSRVVSMAGRWAMRPQTAMAAVFLVTIGSSVVLIQGSRAPRSSAVTVTERGTPAAEIAAPDSVSDKSKDFASAAQAHGPEQPLAQATATAAPIEDLKPAASAAPQALAFGGKSDREEDPRARGGAVIGGAALEPRPAARSAARPSAQSEGLVAMNEDRPASEPAPPKAAAAPGAMATPPAAAAAPPPAGPATEAKKSASASSGDAFAEAMAAYRGGRYAEATQRFDALAGGGNRQAALMAARSAREGSGCATAAGRFDRLASSDYGTAPGYDATLEAGRCYRAMGSFDAARQRFARLLTVPSHAALAQAELDAMSPSRAKAAKPTSTADGF